MKRRQDWALGIILAATTCAGGPRLDVPRVVYYDTRSLVGYQMDSVLGTAVLDAMKQAFPNEEGFCFYGTVEWLLPDPPRRQVRITRVTVAEHLWATEYQYARDTVPKSGCYENDGQAALVGIGHTHPYSAQPDCLHSPADAYVLAGDTRVLMSLVFCGDGTGNVLLQDGRHFGFRWASPS